VGDFGVSGGNINIDSRDVTGEAPAKRKVAIVFQSYALYPHMTVAKDIAFPLKMAARPLCLSHLQHDDMVACRIGRFTKRLDFHRRDRTSFVAPA
jgi:ABC-type sugar transport system ATPase subunit